MIVCRSEGDRRLLGHLDGADVGERTPDKVDFALHQDWLLTQIVERH